MFEIDKEKFGAFVAQLRKEKGLTQKELAEQLFLSDKAISKWERGLSMPDITILSPLADILGVTVTELLNCQRMKADPLPPEEVDQLVQKALTLSEDEIVSPWDHIKHGLFLLFTWLVVGMEWLLLLYINHDQDMMKSEMSPFLLIPAIFGIYFWFMVEEKLPKYYDENKIHYYYHNGFKMNLPGVTLNNSNWPHILNYARIWCTYAPITVPMIYGLIHHIELQTGVGIILGRNTSITMPILLLWMLTTLFIPTIYIGRKYQ